MTDDGRIKLDQYQHRPASSFFNHMDYKGCQVVNSNMGARALNPIGGCSNGWSLGAISALTSFTAKQSQNNLLNFRTIVPVIHLTTPAFWSEVDGVMIQISSRRWKTILQNMLVRDVGRWSCEEWRLPNYTTSSLLHSLLHSYHYQVHLLRGCSVKWSLSSNLLVKICLKKHLRLVSWKGSMITVTKDIKELIHIKLLHYVSLCLLCVAPLIILSSVDNMW